MTIMPILKRSIKWRFHHKFTIVVTILQPILWLLLYTQVAKQSMINSGITNYVTFVFAGLIFLVSFGACSSGGIMNYLMKNDGSFYRVIKSPIKRSSIILGQVMESVLCSLLEVAIMFFVGLFVGLKLNSSWYGILLVLGMIILVNFSMANFAYLMSLVIPNEIMYETAMNAIVLPIFFLSSALFPTEGIDGLLGVIIQANPFTHGIDTIRDIFLNNRMVSGDLLWTASIFLILGTVLFGLTLKKMRQLNLS